MLALFDLAETNLDPGFSPARVPVYGILEKREGAVVVAQPEGVQPIPVPEVSDSFGALRRAIPACQLGKRHKSNRRDSRKAGCGQSQIYVLAVGDFHSNNAHDLAFHIKERTATVPMRN